MKQEISRRDSLKMRFEVDDKELKMMSTFKYGIGQTLVHRSNGNEIITIKARVFDVDKQCLNYVTTTGAIVSASFIHNSFSSNGLHDYKQTSIAEWSDTYTCSKCKQVVTVAAEDGLAGPSTEGCPLA